jgi:hypothetical protein
VHQIGAWIIENSLVHWTRNSVELRRIIGDVPVENMVGLLAA